MAPSPDILPPSLGDLPVELVLEITKSIALSDKYHLMCTCRGMYTLLRNIIYDDDASSSEPRALRWACANGFVDIINEILDKGVSVDHIFSENACRLTTGPEDFLTNRDHAVTPLITAVAFRQLEAVKVLLRRGADVNFVPGEHQSETSWIYDPLVDNADQWNLENLLAYDEPMSFSFYPPIYWAVNPLLRCVRPAALDQDRLTEEIVRTLIAYKPAMNQMETSHSRFMQPLALAVANRFAPISIVRILQDAGAQAVRELNEGRQLSLTPVVMRRPPTTPFHYFVMSRLYYPSRQEHRNKFLESTDEEKLSLLLSKATPRDFDMMFEEGLIQLLMSPPTPVMIDIIVTFLLHVPLAFLRHPGDHPYHPLIAAIKEFPKNARCIEEHEGWNLTDLCEGYMKLFSILIPMPLDRPDKRWGHTALTALCSDTYPEEVPIEDFINLFISKGARLNDKDSRGDTALFYAATHASTRIAACLFSHASFHDLSRQYDPGYIMNVACVAKRNGTGSNTRAGFVDLLLKSGAEVNSPDENGSCIMPVLCACYMGDADLLRVLVEHGTDLKLATRDAKPSLLALALHKLRYRRLHTQHEDEPDDSESDIDEPDNESVTEVVEILLEHGVTWAPGEQMEILQNLQNGDRTFPEELLVLLRESP
ncbi:hypothetical protein O1611_g441 [Lasiodiplodia mahajangana]|uniref:Uncharacterized protein n=1 Tax=Lasiodiplodia mahajangana TaxID=1108764 RepID=A0ACC2K065_9PEZI|nr:hypothetical protein O1611_g441 [Lasiodiplodia mahajangana]